MSITIEQYRSLLRTREFLYSLLWKETRPKNITELKRQARACLRHYPDVVVRSHRHRNIEVRVPSAIGYNISMVSACWQLRTPFTYRIAGGRIATPQIGGSLIRTGTRDQVYTRHFTKSIGRSKEVVV